MSNALFGTARVHVLAQVEDAHEPARAELWQRDTPEGVFEERGQTGDAEACARDVEQLVDGPRVGPLVRQHDDVGPLRLHHRRERGEPAQARNLIRIACPSEDQSAP